MDLSRCVRTQLDLSRNALGDKGAKALASGGAFAGGLTQLNLFCNQIGADGAKAIPVRLIASFCLSILLSVISFIGSRFTISCVLI